MQRSASSPSTFRPRRMRLGRTLRVKSAESRFHVQRSVGGVRLFFASLLLCLLAPSPALAQATENVAHQQYLGLVADPANLVKGSTFYRSDLDTLRFRTGALQTWDGSAWVENACGPATLLPDANQFTAPICAPGQFALFAPLGDYQVFLPMLSK